MAELLSNQATLGKRGFHRAKKGSTRVDLTPMVDLGFLLITFFIFTTTLARPSVMKLVMPDKASPTEPMLSSEDKTLTLLVAKDDRLFYYPGLFKGSMKEIDYHQLRNIIIQKKKMVYKKLGVSNIVILIKVTNEAKFKNIVDSLDEMVINGVSTYMLLDPEAEELEAIK